MSERDECPRFNRLESGALKFAVLVLLICNVTNQKCIAALERDVTEIKKALNIPEEPEKEETK